MRDVRIECPDRLDEDQPGDPQAREVCDFLIRLTATDYSQARSKPLKIGVAHPLAGN